MPDKKLNILVIEDNTIFRELALDMLAGANLFSAASAAEGLAKYAEHKPDITFLDIGLPDRSGHEVLAEIMKKNPKAFVIMLTASKLAEDVQVSISGGAKGYIIKPFSRKQIKEVFDKYHAGSGLK